MVTDVSSLQKKIFSTTYNLIVCAFGICSHSFRILTQYFSNMHRTLSNNARFPFFFTYFKCFTGSVRRNKILVQMLTLYIWSADCFIQRPSSYRAVNTFHLDYKNQSVYAVSGTSRCLFSDKYKIHKYSVGRAYNCWMLNCWCITWPVGFKRLTNSIRKSPLVG